MNEQKIYILPESSGHIGTVPACAVKTNLNQITLLYISVIMSYCLPVTVMLIGLLSDPVTPLVPTAATWNVYTVIFGVRPEIV